MKRRHHGNCSQSAGTRNDVEDSAPRKHRNILISARDEVETDCELRNGKIEV